MVHENNQTSGIIACNSDSQWLITAFSVNCNYVFNRAKPQPNHLLEVRVASEQTKPGKFDFFNQAEGCLYASAVNNTSSRYNQ